MVSKFQVHPFPSTGITDGHRSGQNVLLCHASDNKLSTPFCFCFSRACTMQLKVNCSSCTPLALRSCNPSKTTVTIPPQANISWKQLILQCKEIHNLQSFIFRFEIKVKNRGNYLNDHPTISLSSSATAKKIKDKKFFLLSVCLRASHLTWKNWCQDERLGYLRYRHSKP